MMIVTGTIVARMTATRNGRNIAKKKKEGCVGDSHVAGWNVRYLKERKPEGQVAEGSWYGVCRNQGQNDNC